MVIAAAFYASFLPNRDSSRASGLLNPSEGLSFSGAAVVVQQQTSALKQTSDLASLASPSQGSGPQGFVAGGLLPGTSNDPQSFSAGLLSPLDPSSGSVASSLSAEEEDAQAPDEDAIATATNCDTALSPLYCVYEVQEGDTLSTIADQFGLTSTENFVNWELLVNSNNSVVVDPDAVSPGNKLIIPRGNGTIHTVLTNETLIDIAEKYSVTVEAIMAVADNGLSDADQISIGREILIPNPERFAPVYVPDDSGPAQDESSDESEDGSSGNGDGSSEPPITGGGPSSAAGFVWPAGGPISSYYGPNHPLGIDIDLFNNAGAPISAAMGGVVTFAGGNACCSYGYYVVIDHGNGYQTLYAHLSSVGVSVGEVVGQGQYIGNGGSTGYSTGDHLHFEVTLNGSRVNPMNYLP